MDETDLFENSTKDDSVISTAPGSFKPVGILTKAQISDIVRLSYSFEGMDVGLILFTGITFL